MLWHRCHLVRDIDDELKAEYDMYYNRKTPLDAALLNGHPRIWKPSAESSHNIEPSFAPGCINILFGFQPVK